VQGACALPLQGATYGQWAHIMNKRRWGCSGSLNTYRQPHFKREWRHSMSYAVRHVTRCGVITLLLPTSGKQHIYDAPD
jgi:hypothetical protein